MAERTGLEPATPGVTGRYSNQLNYRSELRAPFEDWGPWGPGASGKMSRPQDHPSKRGANRNRMAERVTRDFEQPSARGARSRGSFRRQPAWDEYLSAPPES
jgi:hypothetical protein